MHESTLLIFAAVAFVGIATPGPTVLLALTNGSRYGLRRAAYGFAGAVASDFVLIFAVALGLGALLAASAFWFTVVKWVGVVYLAYIGVKLLMSKGALNLASTQGETSRENNSAIFLKSFLTAVTNPKGYLFFSAFLPQFITPSAPLAPQYAALAITFAMLDCLIMFGYSLLGARAIRLLKESGALWLERSCGAVLVALAGSLAMYRRHAS
ncbi:amino acid transporter [Burkholderia ubonensis]|uniref:LysE family translocator n=1 Tax=Burkholderia ubonensis TaxID=101571 RepID=UPI00075B59B8|nr:LysE family translocator [Burkholderia ubonensis]KVN94462.1 amino acid transporter [Burkholderia ubonensis]KVO11876.1 amino acid transporter [Burkholderia ubonensis]KVR43343.1 amino acid transporter [Burkholderia ubonensis]KVT92643.1 amino acid transporter [Burkholderia ubonensis]KVU00336.1 amino acid transporter [Burkholderia ubonensis]